MPEMKDRNLEELDEMFIKTVPLRKFRTYRTIGIEHMHDDEVDVTAAKAAPTVANTEIEARNV